MDASPGRARRLWWWKPLPGRPDRDRYPALLAMALTSSAETPTFSALAR